MLHTDRHSFAEMGSQQAPHDSEPQPPGALSRLPSTAALLSFTSVPLCALNDPSYLVTDGPIRGQSPLGLAC
ncbi:unnamed protein product [Protopolystoma xenopodis]|uniref:Uncharacterized protein n=1 Tax=Protopolystoma xenopodis TaxID=117903 RepID=A0A448XT87_9PLAT|nr:unnamed protein product [Protopolystoma xenopodis]